LLVNLDLRCRLVGAAAALAAIVAVALLPAPAAAAEIPPALKQVIAAARKEGALTLSYAGNILGGSEGSRVAAAGIEKMFGVKLDVSYTPGPSFAPMAAKIYTEKQADQPASTDVYNGTAVQIEPFLKRGLFRSVDWTKLMPGRITPEIVEADGRALRIVTGLPGVLYNEHTNPEFGKVVTTADLLKPEYKGKLYTTPYLAGFDVLVADGWWGYARTHAFLQKLSAQIGGLAPCAATDRIASGEVPAIAIDCTGSEQNLAKYRGVLGHVILHDAAMRRYDYLCIPANAAHPNAGILFALYASSVAGQDKIGWDLDGDDLDSYPEAKTRATVKGLQKEGVKFQDVTIAWWGAQHNIATDLKKLIGEIAHR
jgi:ABC-type Fe3+ transport system substrate-binding protein